MWINGWNTSIRSRVIISTWNETVLDNAIPDMEYEITILSCYESEIIFFFGWAGVQEGFLQISQI